MVKFRISPLGAHGENPVDIFEKTSDTDAQKQITAYAKSGEASKRHTGLWTDELKKKYLELSPIEFIRSDHFNVGIFIERFQWLLDQLVKDLRNYFK